MSRDSCFIILQSWKKSIDQIRTWLKQFSSPQRKNLVFSIYVSSQYSPLIGKHHTRFLIEISSSVAIHRFKNRYLNQTGSVAIETFQSSTPGIPQALGNSSRRPATSIPPSRYPLFPENEILWSLAPRTWSLDELPLISSTLSHLTLSLSSKEKLSLEHLNPFPPSFLHPSLHRLLHSRRASCYGDVVLFGCIWPFFF